MRGTQSCPCLPNGACASADHHPLTCDRGFCVADDCPAGAEGCRCYGNATCDPLDGVPMTCDGNACRRTVLPEAGELNGPCLADGACHELDGQQLACRSGSCQLASCPSGALGCPCGLYGRCESARGAAMICNQGRCRPPDCSAGAIGCSCKAVAECGAGEECLSGTCVPGGAVVAVSGEGARGCDVVLGLPELAPAGTDFSAVILGETQQRGRRLALSFIAQADEDLSGDAAVVHRAPIWWGDPALGWVDALQVESRSCYDRLGAPLASIEVTIR